MERAIKKGLIYGFLFGIALAILFIKHYELNITSEGNEIHYLQKFDYLVLLVKRGIVGSFFGAVVAFIIYHLKDSLKLSKKMKFGAIIFGIVIVGPVIQYLVSLRITEIALFN